MYLHTNGILLSKVEEEDLPLLKELKDESWWGTHHIAILNMADQLKWFNSLDSRKELVFIALHGKKEVGLFQLYNLDWINRQCDLSYSVFKTWRNKGYAIKILEAGIDFTFNLLNMHRINTEVLESNKYSYNALIKVGFIEEGSKRHCILRNGKFINSVCLGLLDTDWRKK